MKGCVLIPTYNEAKLIYNLVTKIKRYNLDVIVVDDGSNDDTKTKAKSAGAQVIIHSRNRGKGASLRSGFKEVINKNYDFVVTMDGDGQHHPEDLPNFLNNYSLRKADILVGNRMDETKNMPYLRWLTNKLMSMLISSLCRTYIPDTQCGFRLINKDVLKDIAISTSNYEIESEMLIQASKKKYRIESVPIRTIYEGQASQINPIVDTIRFFKFLLKDRIREGWAILKEFLDDIVIKQGSIIFLSSSLSNVFSLAFWLFMIRKLDHIEYGILNSMVSFLVIISLPVVIFNNVLTKYFSEFQAQDKEAKVQALFRAFFKRITVTSIIIISIVLFFSNNIVNFLHLRNKSFLYLSTFSIFLATTLVLTGSAMQGLQLFRKIAINSIFQGFTKLSIGVALVLFGFKALGGFLGFVFSQVFGLILSLFQLPSWVLKMKRKDYSFHKPEIKLKNIYKYFFPASISLMAYSLFINSDVILVKHFFSESDVGIYSIAQTVGKILLFLSSSITLVFFPVTIQHKILEKNTLPLLKKSLLFVGSLSIVALLFTLAFPQFMMRIISGKVLPECIPLLRFIIFPMSLFSIVYIFIFYNLSLENMRFIRNIFVISIGQIVFICLFHNSLFEVIGVLFIISLLAFYFGVKSIPKNKTNG